MTKHLLVGGLVAAGFDSSGHYLLTVSHSGRGVFSTDTWAKVARDSAPANPEGGRVVGIGPLAGEAIAVVEKNYVTDRLQLVSPDGKFAIAYESGDLTITQPDQ